MSNLTDFFPSGGGGGLTPKFEEFNASGTFTPSQALIDAGGYIEVFLVAGGGRCNDTGYGGTGGEVIQKTMYLNSTTPLPVVIGAGGASNGTNGGDSTFNGVTSLGGIGSAIAHQDFKMGAGWGAYNNNSSSAGSGTLGYGVGGGSTSGGGVRSGKANSGQGSNYEANAGSGYCLIKWYE